MPGKYNLQEMVSFDDLPALKPKFVEIKGVKWISGHDQERGKFIFPADFDEILDVEFATNELLGYYGCSIANTRKDDVVVVDIRHAIQVSNNCLIILKLILIFVKNISLKNDAQVFN